MPWVRKGKVIYRKHNGKLLRVGASSSVSKAKRYLMALYAHSTDSHPAKRKRFK